MKASDVAEDEQTQVVAPLPKSSGEDSDDDEKEEHDMADTSKNTPASVQCHDVVDPEQIPLVESLVSELEMPEDRIDVDHTAMSSVVDDHSVVVAEVVVDAVVAVTGDVLMVGNDGRVSVGDNSNHNNQVMQGDPPSKLATTSARGRRNVRSSRSVVRNTDDPRRRLSFKCSASKRMRSGTSLLSTAAVHDSVPLSDAPLAVVAQSVQVQYDANLNALLLSEDYEGAAALKKVNKDRSTFIMLQSQDAITVPADSTCQETLVKNYEVDLSILLLRRDFEFIDSVHSRVDFTTNYGSAIK
jgi:hypothetical protein